MVGKEDSFLREIQRDGAQRYYLDVSSVEAWIASNEAQFGDMRLGYADVFMTPDGRYYIGGHTHRYGSVGMYASLAVAVMFGEALPTEDLCPAPPPPPPINDSSDHRTVDLTSLSATIESLRHIEIHRDRDGNLYYGKAMWDSTPAGNLSELLRGVERVENDRGERGVYGEPQ
jgi:hypothetical protein